MNYLTVLCGIPCSGKSTWRASFLEKDEFNFAVISSDDIVHRFAKNNNFDYNQAWSLHAKEAGKIMMEEARVAFDARRHVIWDQTNLTPKKRMSILNMAGSIYYADVIYFEVSLEEALKRNATRVNQNLPANVIETMLQQYVRPTKDEGFNHVFQGYNQ